MADATEKHTELPHSVSDWLHGAVDNAYTREISDFTTLHKKELEAAGVVVIGAAAIVGLSKFGGFERTASLLRSVVGGERTIATASATVREVSALGERSLAGKAAVLKDVDTYIFDFDRTLIDTDKAFAAYSNTMHAELTKASGLHPNLLRAAMSETEGLLNTRFFARRLDLIKPLQEDFPGVDVNVKFSDVAPKSEAAYHRALQPEPETVAMLDSLYDRDKGLAMFTGGSPMHTAEKLDASGLQKYFKTVFTNAKHPFEDSPESRLTASPSARTSIHELHARPKDGSAGYQAILRHLGINPARAAMTGDHIEEDVLRAKENGMKGIWATWYTRTGKADVVPDLVLTSAGEMAQILARAVK